MDFSNTSIATLRDAAPMTGFYQLLFESVRLTRIGEDGLEVLLTLDESMHVITDPKQKDELALLIDPKEGLQLEEAAAQLRRKSHGWSDEFCFSKFVLRHASGGVLPLLGWIKEPTFMFFERDIAPMGWNIANGASGTADEVTNVNSLLKREAAEETLFFDPEQRSIHALKDGYQSEELALSIELWEKRLGASRGMNLKPTVLAGPDQLEILYEDGIRGLECDLNICLNAADFGIECTRFINIPGAESLIPIDGEILNGGLLDRRVGLFNSVDAVRAGRPDALFQGGKALDSKENRTHDLCPVSEKLIARYEDQSPSW